MRVKDATHDANNKEALHYIHVHSVAGVCVLPQVGLLLLLRIEWKFVILASRWDLYMTGGLRPALVSAFHSFQDAHF